MSFDLLRLAWGAVIANRLRSFLTVLGIVIGVASVILLTALGEGTRQYIVGQFSQFGTNFVQISPGRPQAGGMPNTLATIRKLTIDDAEALLRVPGVQRVVPAAYGMARAEAGERGRSVFIYGVSADVPEVWRFEVGQGRFLPAGDPRRGSPVAVLGPSLAHELFGQASPLGEYVRIGGRRFLVIGVMKAKGQMLGFDIDDAAYVPVALAQALFNRDGLDELHVLISPPAPVDRVVDGLRAVLTDRHDNEEDFTIVTQTEMLDVLDRVLGTVSAAVAGIGAISLVVGAIGILTMMWIGVGERTNEIGVVIALGATRSQVLALFLVEATLLSVAGGVLGAGVGLGLARLIGWTVPGLPLSTPTFYVGASLVTSVVVGLGSGVLPARRAAGLDPIEALRAE